MALLFTINIKRENNILIARPNCALAGKENIYFTQENFCLQVTLNDINEQNTSFLDCNKHMMKSGASPDKVGVLHRLLSKEFHGFISRIDF